jgi:hypothetical protein
VGAVCPGAATAPAAAVFVASSGVATIEEGAKSRGSSTRSPSSSFRFLVEPTRPRPWRCSLPRGDTLSDNGVDVGIAVPVEVASTVAVRPVRDLGAICFVTRQSSAPAVVFFSFFFAVLCLLDSALMQRFEEAESEQVRQPYAST